MVNMPKADSETPKSPIYNPNTLDVMTALSDCSGYEKIYIALKCVSKIDIVAIVLIKSK